MNPEHLLATPPVKLIPFSSEHKYMASFHEWDGRVATYVKGAPNRILEMSTRIQTPDGNEPLQENKRKSLVQVNQKLAADGLRVLGLAVGEPVAATEGDLRIDVYRLSRVDRSAGSWSERSHCETAPR
jgi:magnesium-transporting ATPase (P-type)